MSLEERFESRVLAACRESRELGYAPVRMEQMIAELGAVRAVRKLVLNPDIQSGLLEVNRLGRLDLSMEQIMLEPEFAGLFADGELASARWRLSQLP